MTISSTAPVDRRRPLALGLTALVSILFVIGVLLLATEPAMPPAVAEAGTDLLFSSPFLVFALVGGVIAFRRPHNPIGWIYLWMGGSMMIGNLATETSRHLQFGGGSIYLAGLAAVASPIFFVLSITAVFYVLLLFPGERAPTALERAVGWTYGMSVVVGLLANSLAPGVVKGPWATPVENLLALEGAAPLLRGINSISQGLTAILIPAAALLLVRRFRRARGVQRSQMKWFAYSAAVATTGILLISLDENSDWRALVLLVGFTGLPVATGAAILRYRLYEIDRIISKTLLYGVVSVALAGGYFGSVLLLQALLPVAGDSPLVVAASTLAMVALFRPLRHFFQDLIDRRFYRRRYDATRTVDEFASSLRQETDLEELGRGLQAVVRSTLQPDHVSVWLAGHDTPERVT